MKQRSPVLQWLKTLTLIVLFLASPLISAPTKTPEKKPQVFVKTVSESSLYDMLTYPARIIPKVNASILSESDGVVQKILTPLGRKVRKNQKIMTLTNTDPIYNFAPVTIRAPVAGVISQIKVTQGSRVTKDAPIAQITDPSQVRIEVELAALDLLAVQAGLEGELTFPSFDTVFPVKVLGVSPYVDPATGTATAELSLPKKKKNGFQLPPGLVGKVSFKVRQHKGFEIADHAIFYQGRDPFIRIVKEGKVKFLPVTLGPTRRGMVEIKKGLEKNMVLVSVQRDRRVHSDLLFGCKRNKQKSRHFLC